MKAIVHRAYGSPAALELREVDTPAPAHDEVLVRVRASSVNPLEWHTVTGAPYIARLDAGLRKPKRGALGTDFAGTVDAVGERVTQFRPGDKVFGGRRGAFAEYVCVPEDRAVLPKPANVTFEQAAAVPLAALTALQGLRDKGRIEPGQQVLINGASGGVGTFAVQIAKALGAEVTGVCSPRNVDIVRSLGADRVVDYTKEDFVRGGERYHLMLDIAGNRSWRECERVLVDDGVLVMTGGPKTNRWLGPLGGMLVKRLRSLAGSRSAVFYVARFDRDDLELLRELLADGRVTPVIDRRYALGDVPEALRYLGEGHAQGKVVITV